MWAYKLLRIKYFHGVSSASSHVYSLKSRYGKVRIELWKVYASQEMGQALHAIYNTPFTEMAKAAITVRETHPLQIPDGIPNEWKLHNYRRFVSDYYILVAWTVEQGMLDMNSIYSRFGSGAFDVWRKVRLIELKLRRSVEARDLEQQIKTGEHEQVSRGEFERTVNQRAEHHVDNDLPIAKVAREFESFVKKRR